MGIDGRVVKHSPLPSSVMKLRMPVSVPPLICIRTEVLITGRKKTHRGKLTRIKSNDIGDRFDTMHCDKGTGVSKETATARNFF